MRSRLQRLVYALVDFGGRAPIVVLGIALALLAASWGYARKLEVHSDVMELLPRDSPGFIAFEHRLERIGGRATIIVVVESPDRKANERLVDAADAAINGLHEPSIAFVESGTKEARDFFQRNKWLYANVNDLEEADRTLDLQIGIQSGMVSDLLDDDEKPKAEKTLGMEKYKKQWKDEADKRDSFPSGYFASADGLRMALWVVSNGAGMGGAKDDELYERVSKAVLDLKPATFHPEMKVGFGGDIPNAKAEKDSLVSEAIVATAIATALILLGIVWSYGTLWSVPLVFFPPLIGVGCAYAFATYQYGFVNSSGAFLGAIVLGNGINYPIVLYSRYREFRGRGMPPGEARREAVWNAFRAELVGALVAAIAYGSLTVTRFRGFTQFGTIGFIGMLLVWITMIPCLPALLVVIEWMQARLPAWARQKDIRVEEDGAKGPVSRFVGEVTAKKPWVFIGLAAILTLVAAWRLPSFLKDPWEYDFDKLGSTGARQSGAFQWSAKAKDILRGTKNLEGALVLADHPEQVAEVKKRILENDAKDPQGSLIESVNTIWDYLPGTKAEQEKKLEVLDRIRDRISERVLARMAKEEADSLLEMKPPEGLKVIAPQDLPAALERRFQEKNGTVGTPFYVDYRKGVSTNDGHTLLRIAATMDGIRLPDGTVVETASRSTVFAEMIKSLERDGPLATTVSFLAVAVVVIIATWSRRGAFTVLLSLVLGVSWTVGLAAIFGTRLNFLNFVALPITFGIGSEYPFNIYDRTRLVGDITKGVKLHMGAVALCSYTTIIGYGSLLFADNQALKSFGKVSISGELACVMAALLVLPAMLHVLARRGSR